MNRRTFTAIIHQDDDLYVVECPDVGTIIEEALANLPQATELYLEEFDKPQKFHLTVTLPPA